MPELQQMIPLPERGVRGISALIDLGAERLRKLAATQVNRPLNLAFSELFAELSDYLDCEKAVLQRAFMDALVPLNGLRRKLELSASDFIRSLTYTLSERAPGEWKAENLAKWNDLREQIAPFFEPDNFFSQASKAFELLSQRPAIFQHVKVLNELRPVYDEGMTKMLAIIQTNTLVLTYWDGERERALHVTLDSSDLRDLSSELERAEKKLSISREDSSRLGIPLVAYGE